MGNVGLFRRAAVCATCVVVLMVSDGRAQPLREDPQGAVQRALDTVLPEVAFEEADVSAAFDWLGRFLRIAVRVDWDEVGFERDARVSCHWKNITAGAFLTLVLADLSDVESRATFTARDDAVVISSMAKTVGRRAVRQLDLSSMLTEFKQRGFDVTAREIAAAIQGAIEPESWSGGAASAGLVVGERNLSVTQTNGAHVAILDLLDQLRRPKRYKPTDSARNQSAYATLQQVCPKAIIDDAPHDVLLDWFADTSGLNVSVDWKALSKHGIEPDRLTNITLESGTLADALSAILAKMNGKALRPQFALIDGVVRISTPAEISRLFCLQVYDVGGIIGPADRDAIRLRLDVRKLLTKNSAHSSDGHGSLWLVGDRLIVYDSYRGLRAVERILRELDPPAKQEP